MLDIFVIFCLLQSQCGDLLDPTSIDNMGDISIRRYGSLDEKYPHPKVQIEKVI